MKRFSAVSIVLILLLCLTAEAAFSAPAAEQRLNLTLKDVSFPEAMRQIFSSFKGSYSVDKALDQLQVSATLKNVTRDQAIRVVCRTAGVVYMIENDAYLFSPKPTVVSTPGEGPAAPRGRTRVELIALRFVSAGEAASLLNASPPDGLVSITATSVNTLMIRGDDEAIADAVQLIELFDVEAALPRAVRLTLLFEISGGELAKPITLTSQGVGLEGSLMPLGVNSSGSGWDVMLDAKLTPTIGLDGSISLTGSGAIDCNTASQTGARSRLSKAFDVAVSAASGIPTDIAAGSSGEGASGLRFKASVTAVVEKGRVASPRGNPSSIGSSPTSLASPQTAVLPTAMAGKPDETHRQAADALLKQIWQAEPGQAKFDAIDAVAAKYAVSDLATRNAIGWLCQTYMKDKSRGILDRWPCCYVITRSKYEPGVPEVIGVLLNDGVEVMRAVAAEALGGMSGNVAARDALIQAERTETSQRVREVLAKYLGK